MQSHSSFHVELSIVTLLEIFYNCFCFPYPVPYTCDTKNSFCLRLQIELQLAFSQLLLELSAKKI